MRHLYFSLAFLCILSCCRTEISFAEKDSLLNGFIEFLNNLPNNQYSYEDGILLSAQEAEDNYYRIETKLKEKDSQKYSLCTCTLKLHENGVLIQGDVYNCEDYPEEVAVTSGATGLPHDSDLGEKEAASEDEPPVEHKPVELDNEIRPNTEATSGEQFVAIPREEPIRRDSVGCIGCASHVDPAAPGVAELAAVGVKQLDRHEPNVKHSLNKVVDVERQVQVVNGVRYIVTMLVDFNNCTSSEDTTCAFTKPCKVSVLEKPWIKLPNGAKYRAILSNNCTEIWLFGDNGEVVSDGTNNDDKTDDSMKPTPDYDKIANTGSADDILKAIYNKDLQSQQTQKFLTEQEIRNLEEQIIPYNQFQTSPEPRISVTESSNHADISKHNSEVETIKQYAENSNTESQDTLAGITLSEEKKKTIDDLMNFFNFAGFTTKDKRQTSRNKRSFSYDIKVMSLLNNYKKVKESLKNAKYIYYVAHIMVDYLNEVYYSKENQILQEVTAAEQESDDHHLFIYLQARVTPQKGSNKEQQNRICNGIIDVTNKDEPEVLHAFCYFDSAKKSEINTAVPIPVDDKVLQHLMNIALEKLESQSSKMNAIKVSKIISASTQRGSGVLTRVSAILVLLNCSKNMPVKERNNCIELENLGSKICEIEIFQKDWLKATNIMHSCIETQIDQSFSNEKKNRTSHLINDKKIVEIAQEALSYLETQSNRINRQKIVEIKSVSTQLIAGLMTSVDFIVGYTNCKNGDDVDIENCVFLLNEKLRYCTVKVWQRPWLEDGKEMKVICNDNFKTNDTNYLNTVPKHLTKNYHPSDEKYDIEMAKESLQKYVQESGIRQTYEVASVDMVKVQVDEGTTKLDFTIRSLDNLNNTFNDLVKCHSLIQVGPVFADKNITVDCEFNDQKSVTNGISGGQIEKDPSSPQYRALADESMHHYLLSSGVKEEHKVISVDKVSLQVVSGSLTRLDFTIKPISKLDKGDSLKCHSKVWEQRWLNKKEITVHCEIKNHTSRAKRQVPGGVSEVDPYDPKYKILAEESMQKYLTSVGTTQAHRVLSVDRVTHQVVAGTKTTLDFTIQPVGTGDVIKCHSDVFEQAWLNKKEITVNCEIKDHTSRAKRQVLGGVSEVDPNDPKYKILAEESMQKYLTSVGTTQAHRVLSVDRVTHQVVAGTKTTLDFTIQPVGTGDVIKCHSDVFEQAWLNNKEITVNCEIKDHTSRAKRQVPGGVSEVDPTDPKYKILAEESMQKYLTSVGTTQAHRILSVDKVTHQVVAGTKTTLDFTIQPVGTGDVIKCHSDVFEQAWLNNKEITVNCEIKDHTSRTKRQVLGGVSEVDPNDPKYKILAEESMQKYLTSVGTTQAHKVLSVNKVTYQVVSGSKTTIDFTIKPVNEGDEIKCHSVIWEQPWLKNKQIKVSCKIEDNKSRSERSLPGGINERDPNDPEYKALAEESMQKYVTSAGITQAHKVISVDKVTYQVVSGSITRIDFTIKPVNKGDEIKCHSKIWEQPWLNNKQINVTCEIEDKKSRIERSLPGGINERDPNDPEYKALAEESMQKYLTSAGMTQAHKVISVDKVTYQVVSGSVTRIDFTIKPINKGDEIKCHSKIWEQPWLNNKQINVTCEIEDKKSSIERSLPGGINERDPNDPEYKALAEESMQKYLTSAGMAQAHKVISVDKVTYQVVSGSITRIDFTIQPVSEGDDIKCHSEVWERRWLNKKEITVNCELKTKETRTKRHIFGGAREEDISDPKYKLLAEESLHKYVTTSGLPQTLRVVTVDKVTIQVVSGLVTRLNFTIAPDDVTDTDMFIKCYAEIWAITWLQQNEINVSCNFDPQRAKRDTFNINKHKGGLVEQDPDNPHFLALAKESLQKYKQLHEIKSDHVVLEVKKVTMQVVAGTMYRINFIANRTSCDVTDIKRSLCNKENNDKYLFCFAKIWSRPWLKQKKIDVSCYNEDLLDDPDDNKINYHNQVINKFNRVLNEKQDANKQEYKEMAKLALKKYKKISNSKHGFKVDKIYHVTEQVTAGITTNIDFAALPDNCLNQECPEPKVRLHCQAEIWEKPGRDSIKDIMSILCKRKKGKASSNKQNIVTRGKRDTDVDENYIEEDLKYYYADAALNKINVQSRSQNLFKLVSIHSIQASTQMRNNLIRMYLEVAQTFCLRKQSEDVGRCDELNGVSHKLCHARLYPAPNDELVIRQLAVTCEEHEDFEEVTGISIPRLLRASIKFVENDPDIAQKMVNLGPPYVIPSLDSRVPTKISFMLGTTNCTKDVDVTRYRGEVCLIDPLITPKTCTSFIFMMPHSNFIRKIDVQCYKPELRRTRRWIPMAGNLTSDDIEIRKLAELALQQLEMESLHRYKQKILEINNYSIKITSRQETHIDFEVGYTNCIKYEWVDDLASCELLEHLPRRQCNAVISETLWNENGKNVIVECKDDETPLEAHIQFSDAQTATLLAEEALRHIEAKYPHPRKQKVARIFSLEKQSVAGLHYRMKMEVGLTNCSALSDTHNCQIVTDGELNKFCRVNVWIRPWIQHAPLFRVTCDYQNDEYRSMYEDVQAQQLFFEFLQTYRPEYADNAEEMERRYNIFRENVKKIHELNVRELGTARYGVTRFADLTYEEFGRKFLGLDVRKKNENNIPWSQAEIPKFEDGKDIPASFDWRKYGAVTEVKDQGSCGSCWAFSVTGNVEGQWKVHKGELVSLSEQELVDCDKLDDGCNGGLPDNAYRAIEQLGGLELENDYPYEGEDDKCSFNKTIAKVQIRGAVNITSNETDMAKWLVKNGPISIGINANAMQFYMGGVSHPWKMLCNPKNLDHGVLIVGYGVKDYPLFNKHLPYWTIKNSWGSSWGEQGYYRVYRGDGTCGVNQMASSALV